MKELLLYGFILFAVFSSLSCGDVFEKKQKITGPYYLLENETGEFGIYRRLQDKGYVGRIPGDVKEYGFNDSFIVAKSENAGKLQFFIVDRINDSDYADQKKVLIGPFDEKEFLKEWQMRLNIHFTRL